VLAGTASVDELQLALVDAVWDVEDPPEVALAAQLWIAEYTGGHRSLESLLGALRTLVAPVPA
jgi:hypothetical protein